MPSHAEMIEARNRELGAVLAEARGRKHLTVTAVAACIGTSRRRYGAMERGEVPIGAAELEALIEVLEIPTSSVWRVVGAAGSARQVVVQAQPGETVQFVVQVQG